VFFAQDTVSVGFPTLIAAKLLRKKIIVRVSGDYAWEQATQRFSVTDSIDIFQKNKYNVRVEFLRRVQTRVCKYADVVIVPSHYFRRIVAGWGVPQKDVRTIYNGISFDTVPQRPQKIPSGNIIISIGRLMSLKGFTVLIEIMPELTDWHLVIVGEGPDAAPLKKLAEKYRVDDRVTFIGALSREEIFGWLKVAHIFVLNTAAESFSFLTLEAMYVGVPVLATNVGGIPEIVTHKKEGILLKPFFS